jgi:O-antigen ligase
MPVLAPSPLAAPSPYVLLPAQDEELEATRGARMDLCWKLVFIATALSPLVNLWASPTGFDEANLTPPIASDPEGLLRLRGAIVVGVAFAAGVFAILSAQAKPGGHAVCLSGLAFASTSVLSGIWGLEPGLRNTLLVLPVMFFVVYVLPPVPLSVFGSMVKKVAYFYTYGTLISLVVSPDRVLETNYAGWVPGFTYRLHGLSLHANGFAPLLVTYFLVRLFLDDRKGKWNFHDFAIFCVLLFAQSKMALGALFLSSVVALQEFGTYRLPQIRWLVVFASIALAVFLTSLDGTTDVPILTDIAKAVAPNMMSTVTTLTGRTQVWNETARLASLNPWFGYGPSLWDAAMQERYLPILGWEPPQAHSQYYQTLGEGGYIGLTGMFLYVTCFTVTSLRLGNRFPMAPCFVAMMIARGNTETVLSGSLDGAFLLHFWLFSFLTLAVKQPKPIAEATPEAPAPALPRPIKLNYTPRPRRPMMPLAPDIELLSEGSLG